MTMQKNHHQMEIQKDPLRNVYVKKTYPWHNLKIDNWKFQAFPFWGPGMPIFKGRFGEWQFLGLWVWSGKTSGMCLDRKMPNQYGQSKQGRSE